MVRVILDPYSSFRDADFTATVTEMGIKEFGEQNTPKAYINFDDGGAPITYPIEVKGKSLVETEENGRAKIKNFGTGKFAEDVKKLGYEAYIDVDPDSYEFGTIPELIGLETTWKMEKGKERIDADGIKKDGYTNFTLTGIKGGKAQPPKQSGKTTPKAPETSKDGVDAALLATWKEVLPNILIDPMTQQEIQKALNEVIKGLATTDPKRAQYLKLGAVRLPALKALENAKFLSQDADQKYSLVV